MQHVHFGGFRDLLVFQNDNKGQLEHKTLPPHRVCATIIDDVMARAIHDKGLSNLYHLYMTLSHKNVQQRIIKRDNIVLPHRMARFSIEEHNEQW